MDQIQLLKTHILADNIKNVVWKQSRKQITRIKKNLEEETFQLKDISAIRLMYHMGVCDFRPAYRFYIKYKNNWLQKQIISSNSVDSKDSRYADYYRFIHQLIKAITLANPGVIILHGNSFVSWFFYCTVCVTLLVLPPLANKYGLINLKESLCSFAILFTLTLPLQFSMLTFFPAVASSQSEIPDKVLPRPQSI